MQYNLIRRRWSLQDGSLLRLGDQAVPNASNDVRQSIKESCLKVRDVFAATEAKAGGRDRRE